jgi:tetratricopeptide (TPR) repeat protein
LGQLSPDRAATEGVLRIEVLTYLVEIGHSELGIDMRAMLIDSVGLNRQFSCDRLVDSAEGNPFYVEELVKMLIDTGAIHASETRWAVDTAQLALTPVPSTVTGVLQARLDCLSGHEQIVLQRAAAISRIFWDAAIAYLGGAGAAQALPVEALQSLRQRELIHQRERSTFAMASEFTFKYALLREVTYERVLKRARREYHAQAARWLVQVAEQAGRADEYAAQIAQHYDQASEAQPAATWYKRAGHHAAARYCNAAAVIAFSRALELTPENDAATRYDLILAREKAYDQHGAHIAQVQDLIMLDQVAVALGDDERRATVALRRAIYSIATGDGSTGLVYAQQAVALAEVAGLPIVAVGANDRWAVALQLRGEYAAARIQAESGLELARTIGDRSGEASLLRILGAVARSQLDYSAAQAAYDQSLHICRQIGDRRGEAKTLIDVGVLAWSQWNYSAARAAYEQGLHICREIDDQHAGAFTLVHLGILACIRGDDSAARTHLEVSCDQPRPGHDCDLTPTRKRASYGQHFASCGLGGQLARDAPPCGTS